MVADVPELLRAAARARRPVRDVGAGPDWFASSSTGRLWPTDRRFGQLRSRHPGELAFTVRGDDNGGVSFSRRLVAVVLVWGVATAFGLAIARWTSVGPIVMTLSRGHGVHVGDLVALMAAYTQAALLTRRLLMQRA